MSESKVVEIRSTVSSRKLLAFAVRVDARRLPAHAEAVSREIAQRMARGEWHQQLRRAA